MATKEELLAHAAHWQELAEAEKRMLTHRSEHDPQWACPEAASARIRMFEATARSLRRESEDGIARCSCHELPYPECKIISTRKSH